MKKKLSQRDKDIQRFGTPKYHDGDKVKTSFTDERVLTIQGEAWSNGHTWMYYFKENQMGCGQQYITPISN